ncbi:hypothetical protein LSTR_LSTR008611 [Laodelphax striatellus]|uniref:Odorant receptor n=1 Tax=Laodelphax striatellus TaxID=195883 RepID=A0A482X1G2_LAOST|nr:hypothetical protein LSTR_LSTR008611 [Laodelphax striatellus]
MSKVVGTFDVRCFRVIGMWQLISSTKGYSNSSKNISDNYYQSNSSRNISDTDYQRSSSKNITNTIFKSGWSKNNIFKSNSSSYFYLLNVSVMSVFVPYVLMEFLGLMTSRYDFVTLTEKLSVNITLLESAVKFIYCYIRRRELADLLGVFEENFLLCMQQNRDTNLKILENYAKNLTGNINLFIIIIYATVGLWNSLPILSCLQGTSCTTLQIMPSWYPIAIDQAPIKQLVYLLEFIIMCYCASLLYSVNCLILAFARMISSQVEILKLSMISLAENAARTVYGNQLKDGQFNGSEILNRRYQKKLDQLQRDCLIDYQRILSQAAVMEKRSVR